MVLKGKMEIYDYVYVTWIYLLKRENGSFKISDGES